VTVAEMQQFLGAYRNRGVAQIFAQNGRVLFSMDGAPPLLVTRVDVDRFFARPAPNVPSAEFVLQPARGNVPGYLHAGLWAYVKQ
jgi:hypothetical protein